MYAIVGKARVAVLQGQLARAQRLLDQASVTMRVKHVDEGSSGSLVHTLVQGLIWEGQGRLTDAVAAFTQVLDSYTRLDCCTGPRGQVLIARANALVADHKLDAALRDAEQALTFARQAQGQLPFSSVTGQAWLMLADIERVRGNGRDAGRDYALAARNLVATLGEQHPDTLRARKGISDT